MPVPGAWSLAGKKALVTGARSGWAGALAGALAEAGADVAVAGSEATAIEEGTAAVRARGGETFGIVGRWDSQEEVEQTFRQVVGELFGLHILVNGPGIEFARPFGQTADDDWTRLFETNLMAPMRWCRAAGAHFSGQKYGRVVNVVSVLAERGLANSAAYSASQAALRGMTQSLALEWARTGTVVNSIGFGWYETRPTRLEEQKDRLVRYLPLRRKGQPRDIATLAVYLASDAAAFVTGQTVYVDGGALAHA